MLLYSRRNKIQVFSVRTVGFLHRAFVPDSAGSDGSEGHFRSSESAFKQRAALQCREWIHTPSHGGKTYKIPTCKQYLKATLIRHFNSVEYAFLEFDVPELTVFSIVGNVK